MNKHHLLDKLKGQMYKGLVFPFFITFSAASAGAVRRNEEVDRDGNRFKEYWQRARYTGLEESASVALARDIVMKSDTREEGQELLVLALSNLVNMGVIEPPKFNTDGVYTIPEHMRKQEVDFVPQADPVILPDLPIFNSSPQPMLVQDQEKSQQNH
jgi:hypothetical protein